MPAELQVSFKQAQHFYHGRVDTPIWIVVHSGETLELPTSAEGMQSFFAGSGSPVASTHLSADDTSLARSVHDWDTAFGAPGVNANGLHLEQAGKAAQHRNDWLDKFSRKMIEEQSAKAVAYWSHHHDIPLVKRGPQDILHKHSGVIAHFDATHAFNTPGGHTDPGQYYPWHLLLGAAGEHVHDIKRPTIVHNPFPVPHFPDHRGLFSKGAHGDKVRFVQWALGIPVDGTFGDQTLAAVKAFQRKHNLRVDGVVGPQTAAVLAHIKHVH